MLPRFAPAIRNKSQDEMLDIVYLAVLTGVATMNGQPWIKDIDLSASFSFGITRSDLVVLVAERIKRDMLNEAHQIVFSAQVAFISVLSDLAEHCGHGLESSDLTVPGMAKLFSEAVSAVSDAQPLVEALSVLTSFSVVHQMRQVVDQMFKLFAKYDPDFALEVPPIAPDTPLVINNLQILLKTTPEFNGVMFGYEFAEKFQNCFKQGYNDLVTDSCIDKLVLAERHAIRTFTNDGEQYDTHDVELTGVWELEDRIQGMIDKYGDKVTIEDFFPETIDGSGIFYFSVRTVDDFLSWEIHAANFKAVKVVVHLETEFVHLETVNK
ncbi:UNVERIFIED_CONTAM: hypothetical protein HDU68_012764 [Siphonaria sp. JEL0065]|nr:hypothetical protein HDU68_012764 [Siphonaria sp. JEL0065]